VEEHTPNLGIGTTLELIRQKGLLGHATPTDRQREENLQHQQQWRIKSQLDEVQRKRDAVERGLSRREEEQVRLRQSVDRFKEYKPEVNLTYLDEYGRELNTKEVR
jgi:U4/U6.U5 tri-snRNP-associated protein 1